ncbi:hypothetical protein G5714_014198 [Onychostoma macrolepis]|uniref:Ribonuclease A-domain domain-containing protein n=1 Tax=Onychostoma macrolepis TaxID=369639 RepID=A0A7J6CC35_9TELE|nr:hypothetical protein G5714_014198 [Onychostoma macrolepis]
MNVQRCDSEIRTRRITGSQNDNSCKEVNTFILANNNQVKAVCTGGEKYTSELPVCVWKANAGFTSLLNADSDRQLPLLTFKLTTNPTYEFDRKSEDINGPISAERFFIKKGVSDDCVLMPQSRGSGQRE